MTLKQLASALAKAEGKKHQASIGDVREILSCLMDQIAKELDGCDLGPTLEALLAGAERRKPKKKRKGAARG